MELRKQKYHYDVYAADGMRDVQWALRNTGRQFRVMYDPMDMTRIELWTVTPSGLKYNTMATPKVTVSRATQERGTEDTSFIFRTIEQNRQIMAAIQLEGERFDLDEAIAAELFGLTTPKNKNISKKRMEEYREKNDRGELDIPLSLPGKRKQDEAEADLTLEYSTVGEYTKSVSNLTMDDLYDRF